MANYGEDYDSKGRGFNAPEAKIVSGLKGATPTRDIPEDGIQDRLNGLASALAGIEMAIDGLRSDLEPVRMERVDSEAGESDDSAVAKPLTRSTVNEALLRLIRRANNIEHALHQTRRELDV